MPNFMHFGAGMIKSQRMTKWDVVRSISYVVCIGLSLQCMCVNESFCVTGSDDGYVRLWPLDFKHVLLEAQHDGPVTGVDISIDCLRVLAATCTVCLSCVPYNSSLVLYSCINTWDNFCSNFSSLLKITGGFPRVLRRL